jgi:Uncharacterized protein conserved in bacteria
MKSLKLAAAAALVAAPLAVSAHHVGDIYKLGPVTVSHVWTEETGDMAHGLDVFLTVVNEGEDAVRLIAADTSFTDEGVFQSPVVGEDGSLAIRDLSAIEIAPGQTITFQPGGLHVSLQNTQRAHDAGDHFHMTLEFETLGALDVEVEVEEHVDHDHQDPAS